MNEPINADTMTDKQRAYWIEQAKLNAALIDRAKQAVSLESNKPILVLDFDGVLHSYVSGWQGAGVANDDPVPGAIEFCQKAIERFTIWIVSSRCGQEGGVKAIMDWLAKWHFPMGMYVSDNGSKPAAFLTLDDRAITFDGHWPDVDLMLQFKPWYKREH